LKGFYTTFKHLFRKPITIEYPEKTKPAMYPRYRGLHFLERYEDGTERCVSCGLCAAACPADAIFVESAENTDAARYSPGERYASTYEINMLRCIYCGYCEDACPTEAIVLGDNYELSFIDRSQSIYTREILLEPAPAGGKTTPQQVQPGLFDRSIPVMKNPD
jgi:NADH-quinone oxidoreductase subunit I